MNTIDTRGLSCPQPVLMAKKAADCAEKEFAVLADNTTAVENLSRFAANAGYKTELTEKNGEFTLKFSK